MNARDPIGARPHGSGRARGLLAFSGALAVACVLTATALTGCSDEGVATTAVMPAATPAVGAGAAATGVLGSWPDTVTATKGGTTVRKRVFLDVPYATGSPKQKLDIYLPSKGTGPYPVVVAIHGGSFWKGDKADGELSPLMPGLDRGYAIVAVNYRFSDEAKFPAQINDIKAAIRFLRANAKRYNLDTTKMVAWGNSAGANLAALAGTSSHVKELTDLSLGNSRYSDRVHAVVDWYGVISFLTVDPQFRATRMGDADHELPTSYESKYLGSALPQVPELVKKADPTTYITKDDPAFLIQHGTKDVTVPVQQSSEFAAALRKVLGADKVRLTIIANAVHADRYFNTRKNVDFVYDWLDKQLDVSR